MCRCEQALELLSRQLDETLSSAEESALSEHLASCETCRTLALELQDLHAAMGGLAAPVPDGFADAVMENIRQEGLFRQEAASRKRNGAWRVWGGLAAAVVLAVVGASRLPLWERGGSSGAAAAAPAFREMADAHPADAASDEAAAPAAGGEASPADRSYCMSVQAPEPPDETPKPDEPSKNMSGMEIIRGCGTADGSVPPDVRGASLSEGEAGCLVLEAAGCASVMQCGSAATEESFTLTGETEDGAQYLLTCTGLGGDESVYQFTLLLPDGTEQYWTVTVDGGVVEQLP